MHKCLRLLLSAAAVALCLANTDVIRLDMSPVRGPSPPATRKYPIAAAPPRIPPEQKPDIFCTNGANPDDIYCDMRRFYGSNLWKQRTTPDIYDFDIEYPDAGRNGVACSASFERPRNRTETPIRMPFSGFKCEGGSGGESGAAGLPPFRMSAATLVRVTARKPEDYYFSCTFQFKKAGDARGRAGGGSAVVRFTYYTISCVSPVTFDRETTANPNPCDFDGRRCRPKK